MESVSSHIRRSARTTSKRIDYSLLAVYGRVENLQVPRNKVHTLTTVNMSQEERIQGIEGDMVLSRTK